MDEKEKRKILISSILIIITLILVVVGTTYAFFSLQIQNSSEPTNIEITTGEQNEITLSGGITNYRIKLDVSDMTEDKIGTPYYGTTVSGKNYEETEEAGTQDIGTLTKKWTLTEKYICSADININLDGDMKDFLQTNDLVLVVKQGSTSNTYDLSNVSTKNTFKFKLDNDNINPIKAYLKFTNQESDQSDLAGTSLNISINISDFTCEIKELHPNVKLLFEKGGDTFKEKSGMLRFIGTKDEVTNNYICFGTDNTETCKNNPDEFMYRIIGVTSEDDNTINLPTNSLKIIKATPSSESQKWNSKQSQADCIVDGIDKCTWDDSDIKTYLNGTNSDQFLGAVQWESPAYWKGLITSQKWYNVDQPSTPTASAGPTDSTTTNLYQIGLMYATDYINAAWTNTSNWLFITNGWNGNTSNDEWTLSRYGYHSLVGSYRAWYVASGGYLTYYSLTNSLAVRPVFYLQSNITLTGEGNTENPFIIHS